MNLINYNKYDHINRRMIKKDTVRNQLKRSVTLWKKLQDQVDVYHANTFMPLYDIGMQMKTLRYLYQGSARITREPGPVDHPAILEYNFSEYGYSSNLKEITSKDNELGEVCCDMIRSLSATDICSMDESFRVGHQFYAIDERLKILRQRSWDIRAIAEQLVFNYIKEEVKFNKGVYEMMVRLKVAGVEFYLLCERANSKYDFFNSKIIFTDHKASSKCTVLNIM